MSLLDFIKQASLISKMSCTTKKMFGKMMHDPNLSDEEKRRVAHEIIMAGGYDGLND